MDQDRVFGNDKDGNGKESRELRGHAEETVEKVEIIEAKKKSMKGDGGYIKKSDRDERIEEVIWLRKIAEDERRRAGDRRAARKKITKIAEEYNITFKDVFERMDKRKNEK